MFGFSYLGLLAGTAFSDYLECLSYDKVQRAEGTTCRTTKLYVIPASRSSCITTKLYVTPANRNSSKTMGRGLCVNELLAPQLNESQSRKNVFPGNFFWLEDRT